MNVLITGANRGLGLEFVKQLLDRGDTVIATARRPEAATELQAMKAGAGERLTITQLDVDSPDDWCDLAGQLSNTALDVLINNAGAMVSSGTLGALNYDAISACFNINTLGPLRGLEACLPALRRGEGKKVITITSKMGSMTDNTSGGAYGYRVSKSAVNSAMRSAAMDLKPDNFTVVVMHPGWVQTDMGGTNALIDIPTSITGMLKVIDRVGPEETGSFWEWNDKQIGW
ncbi:MAG: NAD(P)-dependent dehydrogenase (short-subunit alcohol dehydrogenase family) [Bradymonadia bacterium]|jgi:NAD(P)-dependent dehydrogenase (short-subunit alcohol dehydrogenase family)